MPKINLYGVDVEIPESPGDGVVTDAVIILRKVNSDGDEIDDVVKIYQTPHTTGILLTGMLNAVTELDRAAWHQAVSK